MEPFAPRSTSQQLAAHLKTEIHKGAFGEAMPGIKQLKRTLGVNSRAVEDALHQLESEGLLVPQGAGRPRLIRIPKDSGRSAQLRVAIMRHEPEDKAWTFALKLHSRLQDAGWQVHYAPKTLKELGMDPQRVGPCVQSVEADARVVIGASREVLEWFARRPTPVMSCFGRPEKTAIAQTGVITSTARVELVRRLHALGHRRIVMLSERMRRLPQPGVPEQSVLDEMERLGIPTGAYNLPDWDDTPDGLRACLDSLFAVTPPEALIIGSPAMFLCVRDHLRDQGLQAPEDVSLICIEYDPTLAWLQPEPTRIESDSDQVVQQIFRWLRGVARGRPTKRKAHVEARLIEGGTVGPAPK